jgi:hypothetical protein
MFGYLNIRDAWCTGGAKRMGPKDEEKEARRVES